MTELPMQQVISAVYRRLAHGAPRGTYAGYEHEMVDAYMRACAASFARDGHTGLLSAATRGALDLLRQNGRAWAARLTGRSERLSAGWRRQRAGSARPPRPGCVGPVIQDVKTAYRSLARSPGFALGVALTLGLGIGATTTIYSVVNGVMLRPLPYEQPQALVVVGALFPGREWDDARAGLQHLAGVSMLNYRDLKERARSFEDLAAIEVRSVLLPDEGSGPELASAVAVSPEFFRALNLSPVLGRTFLPEEYSTASEATFMLSYGAWQRRYGGDPAVVGRPLEQVGTPATVVGILPRDFVPPEALFSRAPDYWMPLQPDHGRYVSRGRRSLTLLGRLETGTSVELARIEVASIADALAAEFPDGNVYPDGEHLGIGVNDLHAETVGTTGRTLAIFLGASAMLLLLSVLNAATLLLARALDRIRELGVRMALGAGRTRLIRLLLVEAGLLSILGGVVGVLVAYGGVSAFLRYAPSSIPRTSSVSVDAGVLAACALVSLAAGLAAGLLPALRLTRCAPWEQLHGAGRSHAEPTSRLRGVLVGGQIALAVLLLSGAGLLFSSFMRLQAVEPGFEPAGLISMRIGLKRPGAAEEAAWQGWDLVLEEVASVPGAVSVAGTSNPPFQAPFWAPWVQIPGDSPDLIREGIAGYSITPGYLETVGTRLLQGRVFDRRDGPEGPYVALVNESFVRTQLDGQEPVGMELLFREEGDERRSVGIVGLVEDVIQGRAEEGGRPAVYVPYTQVGWPFVQVVVRSELPADVMIPELRKAAARFSPIVPPQDLRTMQDRIAATRTTPRFQLLLFGAFALVALFLAAVGLYGSLAHAVGRRQRELGIRMALGAARTGVLWMVLREGMRVSAIGLVLGQAVALAATRVLAAFLYEVEPGDPVTLLGVSVVLATVAAAACILPAQRATTVDPVEVLRAE